MVDIKLLATLQPAFTHFSRFSRDERLSGIRLNNPQWSPTELGLLLQSPSITEAQVPLYFDVKGWQLRVTELHRNDEFLDITINHPIKVDTPTPVHFKAGADRALLERVEQDGRRLIFRGGPRHVVYPGESLQIRHPSLEVLGEQFCADELEKISVARKAGITRYFLSYAESQPDVYRLQELVGADAEIMIKIENEKGIAYAAKQFRKRSNHTLVAARGDLYVEVKRPHDILDALRVIVSRDPEACVGSRLMLSVINSPVPACSDFCEMAWLYDIGYRSFLLCDELCLQEDLLNVAIGACEAFRRDYNPPVTPSVVPSVAETSRSVLPAWMRVFGRR
jgi:hypothetical protein